MLSVHGWCAFLVSCTLLGGCTLKSGLTHNTPSFQGSTAKLDSVYARCVQARWVTISPTVHIVETPTSLQVVVTNPSSDVEELLVIHSKGVGADVVLYERREILALRAYRESAKGCL
jgi:hypothetical protein